MELMYSDESGVISVSLSYNCNLNCLYCYQQKKNINSLNDKELKRLTLHTIKYIKDNFSKKKFLVFDLMGGEITKNINDYMTFISNIINSLNEYNFKIAVYISTNGTDTYNFFKLYNFLKKYKNIFYIKTSVSLDLEKNICDKYRNNTYELVKNNLNLIDRRIKNDTDSYLSISSVITEKISKKEIIDISSRFEIHFKPLILSKNYSLKYKKTLIDLADKIIDIYNDPQIRRTIKKNIHFDIIHFEFTENGYSCCLNNRILVNSDGFIYSCPSVELKTLKNNVNKEILKLDFSNETFEKNKYDKAIKEVSTIYCNNCHLYKYCKHNCFLMINNQDDVICNNNRKFVALLVKKIFDNCIK